MGPAVTTATSKQTFVNFVIEKTVAGVPAGQKEREEFAVKAALANLPEFGEKLAETIYAMHAELPGKSRFMSVPGEKAIIFLDGAGHLVKLTEPHFYVFHVPRGEELGLIGFESGTVLTGRPGAQLRRNDMSIPGVPVYLPSTVAKSFPQESIQALEDATLPPLG